MVSIVVREPRALEVESANVPEPKADEVVVKVRRAGICGSDVHILHGSNPFAVYPRVIGHEFAGEVFSVGAAITGIKVGDRVVVDPVLSCGDCYPCGSADQMSTQIFRLWVFIVTAVSAITWPSRPA